MSHIIYKSRKQGPLEMTITTIRSLAHNAGMSLEDVRRILSNVGIRIISDDQVLNDADTRRMSNYVARKAFAIVAGAPGDSRPA